MNPSIILNRPGSGLLTLIPSLYRTWGGSMGIAAGLGDDYTDTSMTTGHLPRCKKGDGVLSLNDGAARVVIEMTDSARTGCTDYFADAERNRDAVARWASPASSSRTAGRPSG